MEQQHGFPLPVAPCFSERASVKIGRWHLEKKLVFFFCGGKNGDINIPQED